MPIDIRVLDPRRHPNIVPHRIVPIRFARAITGFADATAKDLDDRGFAPTKSSQTRGPSVGMAQGTTTLVKVVRDRLDASVLLFPAISPASVATLVNPTPGAALDSTDTVLVRGTGSGADSVEAKLSIHFKSPTGPLMAELGIIVHQPMPLSVLAHRVVINGRPPDTDQLVVASLFAELSKIYSQAGVVINPKGGALPTFQQDLHTGFKRTGTISLETDEDSAVLSRFGREIDKAGKERPIPAMNIYFVHDLTPVGGKRPLGFGVSSANASVAGGFPGIVVRDDPDLVARAINLGHELGHSLNLTHYATGEIDAATVRHDLWAHRNNMHNFSRLRDSARPPERADNKFKSSRVRTTIGYGSDPANQPLQGQVLGSKDRLGVLESNQVRIIRGAIDKKEFIPIL